MVPAQLHREVIALPNDMRMAVDQTRDHTLAAQIDCLGLGARKPECLLVCTNSRDLIPRYGHSCSFGHVGIHCRDLAVEEYLVWGGHDLHPLAKRDWSVPAGRAQMRMVWEIARSARWGGGRAERAWRGRLFCGDTSFRSVLTQSPLREANLDTVWRMRFQDIHDTIVGFAAGPVLLKLEDEL